MSFGYHVDMPRIPGRPLGCCKQCRQRARWSPLAWPNGVCTRCGLERRRIRDLLNLKRFVVFEDTAGNVVMKAKL